jgi:predicted CXXCH cytochrome family protein
VEFGVGVEVPETANGLECFTCHDNFGNTFDVAEVAVTRYPGGLALAHDGYDNICATCHSGRESKATIDRAIDEGNLGFRNVHYLPAAGVRNGSQSHVGYEYDGMTYAGFLQHDSRTQCAGCHDPVTSNHTFRIEDVWDEVCDVCHNDQDGPEEIRMVHLDDYDGDGNTTELLSAELDGLSTLALLAMQNAAPSPICYAGDSYPYWFVDNGGSTDGLCAEEDANFGNQFEDWTPELMRAAHNVQLEAKEPGAYAHNFDYMAQLLYDAITDLGGDTTNLLRP